jgi:hypothetical protein
MKPYLVTVVLLSLATAASAEDYDGSKPMVCSALEGHDCLPGQAACKPLTPGEGKPYELKIDVAGKIVQTPYRVDKLPISSVSKNTKSLVLQGTSLEFVWNATVNRMTGRLTVTIADREGAVVAFGQCKVAGAKPQ